jgi:hypothetical protein
MNVVIDRRRVVQKEHLALASGWKRQEVPNAGLVDAITTTDVSAE